MVSSTEKEESFRWADVSVLWIKEWGPIVQVNISWNICIARKSSIDAHLRQEGQRALPATSCCLRLRRLYQLSAPSMVWVVGFAFHTRFIWYLVQWVPEGVQWGLWDVVPGGGRRWENCSLPTSSFSVCSWQRKSQQRWEASAAFSPISPAKIQSKELFILVTKNQKGRQSVIRNKEENNLMDDPQSIIGIQPVISPVTEFSMAITK